MLNLRLTSFQDGDSVRQLHAQYGSLESSLLHLLWQLFLENRNLLEDPFLLPSLRALFLGNKQSKSEAYYPQWLSMVFPEEDVRLPMVAFRNGALFYYIEAAAVRVDRRGELREIRRRLQSLGGKLARLRGVAGREAEQQAVVAQMEELRPQLRYLPYRPRLDLPQLWWHWTMVRAYESLSRRGTRRLVSPQQVARLCTWLSVPEIGLHCTPATIKAARRRFVNREWFGQQYPTYIVTPRKSTRLPTMELETAKDAASGQAEESIRYTCHICHVSKMDTLHGLGLHLQEKHQIQGDAVEIPEEGTLICEKATQKVLATWEE